MVSRRAHYQMLDTGGVKAPRLSRRAILAGAPALLLAQAPPQNAPQRPKVPEAPPLDPEQAPTPEPTTPEGFYKQALAQQQQAAAQLANVDLPMATEPAAHFKA